MTYETDKAYRATRSLLADHIRGERAALRRYRADVAKDANDTTSLFLKTWNEAMLFASERTLQNLRYLSAEMRGR